MNNVIDDQNPWRRRQREAETLNGLAERWIANDKLRERIGLVKKFSLVPLESCRGVLPEGFKFEFNHGCQDIVEIEFVGEKIFDRK